MFDSDDLDLFSYLQEQSDNSPFKAFNIEAKEWATPLEEKAAIAEAAVNAKKVGWDKNLEETSKFNITGQTLFNKTAELNGYTKGIVSMADRQYKTAVEKYKKAEDAIENDTSLTNEQKQSKKEDLRSAFYHFGENFDQQHLGKGKGGYVTDGDSTIVYTPGDRTFKSILPFRLNSNFWRNIDPDKNTVTDAFDNSAAVARSSYKSSYQNYVARRLCILSSMAHPEQWKDINIDEEIASGVMLDKLKAYNTWLFQQYLTDKTGEFKTPDFNPNIDYTRYIDPTAEGEIFYKTEGRDVMYNRALGELINASSGVDITKKMTLDPRSNAAFKLAAFDRLPSGIRNIKDEQAKVELAMCLEDMKNLINITNASKDDFRLGQSWDVFIGAFKHTLGLWAPSSEYGKYTKDLRNGYNQALLDSGVSKATLYDKQENDRKYLEAVNKGDYTEALKYASLNLDRIMADSIAAMVLPMAAGKAGQLTAKGIVTVLRSPLGIKAQQASKIGLIAAGLAYITAYTYDMVLRDNERRRQEGYAELEGVDFIKAMGEYVLPGSLDFLVAQLSFGMLPKQIVGAFFPNVARNLVRTENAAVNTILRSTPTPKLHKRLLNLGMTGAGEFLLEATQESMEGAVGDYNAKQNDIINDDIITSFSKIIKEHGTDVNARAADAIAGGLAGLVMGGPRNIKTNILSNVDIHNGVYRNLNRMMGDYTILGSNSGSIHGSGEQLSRAEQRQQIQEQRSIRDKALYCTSKNIESTLTEIETQLQEADKDTNSRMSIRTYNTLKRARFVLQFRQAAQQLSSILQNTNLDETIKNDEINKVLQSIPFIKNEVTTTKKDDKGNDIEETSTSPLNLDIHSFTELYINLLSDIVNTDSYVMRGDKEALSDLVTNLEADPNYKRNEDLISIQTAALKLSNVLSDVGKHTSNTINMADVQTADAFKAAFLTAITNLKDSLGFVQTEEDKRKGIIYDITKDYNNPNDKYTTSVPHKEGSIANALDMVTKAKKEGTHKKIDVEINGVTETLEVNEKTQENLYKRMMDLHQAYTWGNEAFNKLNNVIESKHVNDKILEQKANELADSNTTQVGKDPQASTHTVTNTSNISIQFGDTNFDYEAFDRSNSPVVKGPIYVTLKGKQKRVETLYNPHISRIIDTIKHYIDYPSASGMTSKIAKEFLSLAQQALNTINENIQKLQEQKTPFNEYFGLRNQKRILENYIERLEKRIDITKKDEESAKLANHVINPTKPVPNKNYNTKNGDEYTPEVTTEIDEDEDNSSFTLAAEAAVRENEVRNKVDNKNTNDEILNIIGSGNERFDEGSVHLDFNLNTILSDFFTRVMPKKIQDLLRTSLLVHYATGFGRIYTWLARAAISVAQGRYITIDTETSNIVYNKDGSINFDKMDIGQIVVRIHSLKPNVDDKVCTVFIANANISPTFEDGSTNNFYASYTDEKNGKTNIEGAKRTIKKFLETHDKEGKLAIFGHNSDNFDIPLLKHKLYNNSEESFFKGRALFDTLTIYRMLGYNPNSTEQDLKVTNLKLSTLFESVTGTKIKDTGLIAHDARGDTKFTADLVDHFYNHKELKVTETAFHLLGREKGLDHAVRSLLSNVPLRDNVNKMTKNNTYPSKGNTDFGAFNPEYLNSLFTTKSKVVGKNPLSNEENARIEVYNKIVSTNERSVTHLNSVDGTKRTKEDIEYDDKNEDISHLKSSITHFVNTAYKYFNTSTEAIKAFVKVIIQSNVILDITKFIHINRLYLRYRNRTLDAYRATNKHFNDVIKECFKTFKQLKVYGFTEVTNLLDIIKDNTVVDSDGDPITITGKRILSNFSRNGLLPLLYEVKISENDDGTLVANLEIREPMALAIVASTYYLFDNVEINSLFTVRDSLSLANIFRDSFNDDTNKAEITAIGMVIDEHGLPYNFVKRRFGEKIASYLGIRKNEDSPIMGMYDTIIDGLGEMAIEIAKERGLISVHDNIDDTVISGKNIRKNVSEAYKVENRGLVGITNLGHNKSNGSTDIVYDSLHPKNEIDPTQLVYYYPDKEKSTNNDLGIYEAPQKASNEITHSYGQFKVSRIGRAMLQILHSTLFHIDSDALKRIINPFKKILYKDHRLIDLLSDDGLSLINRNVNVIPDNAKEVIALQTLLHNLGYTFDKDIGYVSDAERKSIQGTNLGIRRTLNNYIKFLDAVENGHYVNGFYYAGTIAINMRMHIASHGINYQQDKPFRYFTYTNKVKVKTTLPGNDQMTIRDKDKKDISVAYYFLYKIAAEVCGIKNINDAIAKVKDLYSKSVKDLETMLNDFSTMKHEDFTAQYDLKVDNFSGVYALLNHIYNMKVAKEKGEEEFETTLIMENDTKSFGYTLSAMQWINRSVVKNILPLLSITTNNNKDANSEGYDAYSSVAVKSIEATKEAALDKDGNLKDEYSGTFSRAVTEGLFGKNTYTDGRLTNFIQMLNNKIRELFNNDLLPYIKGPLNLPAIRNRYKTPVMISGYGAGRAKLEHAIPTDIFTEWVNTFCYVSGVLIAGNSGFGNTDALEVIEKELKKSNNTSTTISEDAKTLYATASFINSLNDFYKSEHYTKHVSNTTSNPLYQALIGKNTTMHEIILTAGGRTFALDTFGEEFLKPLYGTSTYKTFATMYHDRSFINTKVIAIVSKIVTEIFIKAYTNSIKKAMNENGYISEEQLEKIRKEVYQKYAPILRPPNSEFWYGNEWRAGSMEGIPLCKFAMKELPGVTNRVLTIVTDKYGNKRLTYKDTPIYMPMPIDAGLLSVTNFGQGVEAAIMQQFVIRLQNIFPNTSIAVIHDAILSDPTMYPVVAELFTQTFIEIVTSYSYTKELQNCYTRILNNVKQSINDNESLFEDGFLDTKIVSNPNAAEEKNRYQKNFTIIKNNEDTEYKALRINDESDNATFATFIQSVANINQVLEENKTDAFKENPVMTFEILNGFKVFVQFNVNDQGKVSFSTAAAYADLVKTIVDSENNNDLNTGNTNQAACMKGFIVNEDGDTISITPRSVAEVTLNNRNGTQITNIQGSFEDDFKQEGNSHNEDENSAKEDVSNVLSVLSGNNTNPMPTKVTGTIPKSTLNNTIGETSIGDYNEETNTITVAESKNNGFAVRVHNSFIYAHECIHYFLNAVYNSVKTLALSKEVRQVAVLYMYCKKNLDEYSFMSQKYRKLSKEQINKEMETDKAMKLDFLQSRELYYLIFPKNLRLSEKGGLNELNAALSEFHAYGLSHPMVIRELKKLSISSNQFSGNTDIQSKLRAIWDNFMGILLGKVKINNILTFANQDIKNLTSYPNAYEALNTLAIQLQQLQTKRIREHSFSLADYLHPIDTLLDYARNITNRAFHNSVGRLLGTRDFVYNDAQWKSLIEKLDLMTNKEASKAIKTANTFKLALMFLFSPDVRRIIRVWSRNWNQQMFIFKLINDALPKDPETLAFYGTLAAGHLTDKTSQDRGKRVANRLNSLWVVQDGNNKRFLTYNEKKMLTDMILNVDTQSLLRALFDIDVTDAKLEMYEKYGDSTSVSNEITEQQVKDIMRLYTDKAFREEKIKELEKKCFSKYDDDDTVQSIKDSIELLTMAKQQGKGTAYGSNIRDILENFLPYNKKDQVESIATFANAIVTLNLLNTEETSVRQQEFIELITKNNNIEGFRELLFWNWKNTQLINYYKKKNNIYDINLVKGHYKQLLDSDIELRYGLESQRAQLEKEGYKFYTKLGDENSKLCLFTRSMITNAHVEGAGLSYTKLFDIKASLRSEAFALARRENFTVEETVKEAENYINSIEQEVDKARFKYENSKKENKNLGDLLVNYHVIKSGKGIDYAFAFPEKDLEEKFYINKDIFEIVRSTEASTTAFILGKERNKSIFDYLKKYQEEHMHPLTHRYRSNTSDPNYTSTANIRFIKIEAESNHPFLKKMLPTLPQFMKDYLKENEIWVREDWLDSLLGIKDFSMTQLKYVKSHENLRKFVAYTEALLKFFSRIMKTNILIRTPKVLFWNIVSNFITTAMSGHNILKVLQYSYRNLKRTFEYIREEKKLEELKIQLEFENNKETRADINAQIIYLTKKTQSSIIHEFYKSGHLQSILDETDTAKNLNDMGTMYRLLQRHVASRVPNIAQETIKQIYLAEGTLFYNLMYQATQLSDFIARVTHFELEMEKYAATYEKDEKGNRVFSKTYEEIKQREKNKVLDLFINYEVPQHTYIQYANDIGLAMFTKYAARIQGIIFKLFKVNPAAALFYIAVQFGTGINLEDIVDQNIFSKKWSQLLHFPGSNAINSVVPMPLQWMYGSFSLD